MKEVWQGPSRNRLGTREMVVTAYTADITGEGKMLGKNKQSVPSYNNCKTGQLSLLKSETAACENHPSRWVIFS